MLHGIEQFSKQLLHFDTPTHAKLTRTTPHDSSPGSPGFPSQPSQKASPNSNPLHFSILHQLRQLMSSCLVVRLGDVTLYRVTTAKSRQTPKEFIAGNTAFPILLSFITIEHFFSFDLLFRITACVLTLL